MSLVSSFDFMLQGLAVVMTTPSFANFQIILTGWVFARRRTITGMLVAVGVAGRRHHASFHRLFANARWSRDALGLAVFRLLEPWIKDGTILLSLDDTLARKRGKKVFGAGMHHDPLISSRSMAVTSWAHSWVILAVALRFPLWPERSFSLPVLFRLYLNKKAASKGHRTYRTRPELAVEMLHLLCRQRKQRQFHVIADSAYGGQSVLCQLPTNCDLTSRLLQDARLYELPPPRVPGKRGRRPHRGQRLPSPEKMLQGRCRHVTMNLYGRHDKVRLADTNACVYSAPNRLLRVVAVEPLTGGCPRQAFYSTCHEATAEQVLTWFAMRWSLEVAIHDSKMHLGFEEPQGWTRRAVERTAPVAMLMYSLIVLWFVQDGHVHYRAPKRPWYRGKQQASFGDILATLRRLSIREQIIRIGLSGPGSQKIIETLENTLALAA